jgi:hypothetical protein
VRKAWFTFSWVRGLRPRCALDAARNLPLGPRMLPLGEATEKGLCVFCALTECGADRWKSFLWRISRWPRIRVRHDATRFDLGEVLERARSRLGERPYRAMTNNCEHCCAWALRGESHSKQVDQIRVAPRTLWRAICAAAGLMIGIWHSIDPQPSFHARSPHDPFP